jgi:polyisoprenyl-teichoic acid--peptidoglycan teichoic acid transferase
MASLRIDLNSKSENIVRSASPGFRSNGLNKNTAESNRKAALDNLSKLNPAKPKRKGLIWKILLGVLLLCGIGGGVYYYLSTDKNAPPNSIIKNINKRVTNVVKPKLQQDENGHTNFLLIGKDTREYSQGLQNTDTVMVGSYNNETGDILLISIPRDTYVKYPDYRRINSIYATAERQEKGSGVESLKVVVKDITGLDVHYWGVVDLGGFKKAIDIVGGVDVDVENAFVDYSFPADTGGGYRTVRFEEGMQHMDGKTALDYARSRKGTNGEGSDYSRARRQQKVIKAFLAKISTMENLNLQTILDLQKAFNDTVTYSPVGVNDIRAALDQMDKTNPEMITSLVLDPSLNNGQLIERINPAITGGAYVIGPKAGLTDWSKVQAYVQGVIKSPSLYREAAKIYTYNGGLGYTKTNTETNDMRKALSALSIIYAGNNNADDVYDVVILVNNEKPETIKALKENLEADGFVVDIVREITGFGPRHKEDISIVFGTPKPVEEVPAETTETTTN